ncbi:MAG: metal-sensitive transcriptional regulator [Candidatus Roizmanbacteria bacterium]|nr:metal-sensitive transcriptional regulator [Candidatus Roizmanbacteria bacterium]
MEQLDKRVSRILGQLRGIQKMVQERRNQVEILQQVSAVKKAINGLSKEVILQYFEKITPKENQKEIEMMIQRTIDL